MADQAERLTIAEFKIAQHEKLHEETAQTIKSIGIGVDTLLKAEVRRENDVATFERIFKAIKILEERLDALNTHLAAADVTRLEKELAGQNKWIGELLRTSLACVAAIVLYHFGVKPL